MYIYIYIQRTHFNVYGCMLNEQGLTRGEQMKNLKIRVDLVFE